MPIRAEGEISSPVKDVGLAGKFRRSLYSYYMGGFLSRREFIRFTPPLNSFLKEQTLRVSTRDFPQIYTYFRDTEGVFVRGKHSAQKIHTVDNLAGQKIRGTVYAVDPSIMQDQLPELKALLLELREKRKPVRTAEERQALQQQLLRVKNADGSLKSIAEDEAYERLLRYAVYSFRAKGHSDESDDLASEIVIKMMPYIEGEQGEFENFNQFLGGVVKVSIRNLSVDLMRRNKSAPVSVDISTYSGLAVQNQAELQDTTAQNVQLPLEKVSDRQRAVLQLRAMGLSHRGIASVLGISDSTSKAHYFQALERLNPDRQKKCVPRFVQDGVLIEAYRLFRADFLGKNGRLPTLYAIERAKAEKKFLCSSSTLRRRFGNNSWPKAQARLEELLEQRA